MPFCVVIGCSNNLKATKLHEKDVSYHMFPKNPQRRNAWMNRFNQPFKFNIDKSHVCSKHFVHDDFVCNRLIEQLLNIKITRKKLKTTAIPSINIPNSLEEKRFTKEAHNPDTSLKYINRSDEQNICAVPICNNSIVYYGSDEPNSKSEIVLYKLPIDTVTLEKSLKFCNNYKSISDEYQNAQICSEHFNKDKYRIKSLLPIKILKKDAVSTLNYEIKNKDELSKIERKKIVETLLADYEEQQHIHLKSMETKDTIFFSPIIDPNPITFPVSKKRKISTTPKLNTECLETPILKKLLRNVNQNIQITAVKGEFMLHALPQVANVFSTYLEKTVTDEEEEIIVTEDEALHIDLSSYEEEDKGNNTKVIIVTDL